MSLSATAISEEKLSLEFIHSNRDNSSEKFKEFALYCRLCENHLKAYVDVTMHIESEDHKLLKRRFRNRQLCSELLDNGGVTESKQYIDYMLKAEKSIMNHVDHVYEKFPISVVEEKLSLLRNYIKGYEIEFSLFGSYHATLSPSTKNPIIDCFVDIRKTDGSEVEMKKKLLVFNELPFTETEKTETAFSGIICKLEIGNRKAKLFCTFDQKAHYSSFSSRLLSLYAKLIPVFRKLALVFRYWAKGMKLLASDRESRLSGSIFDYMTLYFMQQRLDVLVIDEALVGCPLIDFLQLEKEAQVLKLKPIFRNCFSLFKDFSVGSLFMRMILFYGCQFDYSKYIQLTSNQAVIKENGGLHSIKFMEPITTSNTNIFSMSSENLVYFENLLQYGLNDILQPLDNMGHSMKMIYKATNSNRKLPCEYLLFDETICPKRLNHKGLDSVGMGIWELNSIRRPVLYCAFCPDSNDHIVQNCSKLQPAETNDGIVDGLEAILAGKIQRYFDRAKVGHDHKKNAKEVIKMLEKLAKRELATDLHLRAFGSSISGLGTAFSDIDLCIRSSSVGGSIKDEDKIDLLRKIGLALDSKGNFNTKLISAAKVPVLRFVYATANSKIKVDISHSNELALWNTKLMKTYANFDDRVAPLIVAVKGWAKLCGINDASCHTFSSYGLSIMAVHFLQRTQPPCLPYLQNKREYVITAKVVDGCDVGFVDPSIEYVKEFCKNADSLGQLFVQFFDYFNVFNWEDNVIQIREKQPLDKLEKGWTRSPIAVEDPFDLTHNLTNGIQQPNFYQIKKCINVMSNEFRKPKNAFLAKDFTFNSEKLQNLMPIGLIQCFKCKNWGHRKDSCPN